MVSVQSLIIINLHTVHVVYLNVSFPKGPI